MQSGSGPLSGHFCLPDAPRVWLEYRDGIELASRCGRPEGAEVNPSSKPSATRALPFCGRPQVSISSRGSTSDSLTNANLGRTVYLSTYRPQFNDGRMTFVSFYRHNFV